MLVRLISSFLTRLWRKGYLIGQTPEQAFFVKCDEDTNPPEVRDVGEVICEIGVAIVRPLEFIVFRIGQRTSDIVHEEPV
jgi:phage tail sheath protein FI